MLACHHVEAVVVPSVDVGTCREHVRGVNVEIAVVKEGSSAFSHALGIEIYEAVGREGYRGRDAGG